MNRNIYNKLINAMSNNNIQKIVLVILLILAVVYIRNLRKDLKTKDNLELALNDTIKTWKDKQGRSHSKIIAFETQNAKDFLNLKTKDKEILELQDVVKEYKKALKKQGSATNFESETIYDTIYEEIPGAITDSSYYSSINNDWIKSEFGYIKDSSFFRLKVVNKYSLIIGSESNGLFKKRVPFAEVINHNPYSQTTKLRTYQVQIPDPRRFGVGVFAGPAITSDLIITPVIGVGLYYSIFSF